MRTPPVFKHPALVEISNSLAELDELLEIRKSGGDVSDLTLMEMIMDLFGYVGRLRKTFGIENPMVDDANE